jgi:hypothetical protein
LRIIWYCILALSVSLAVPCNRVLAAPQDIPSLLGRGYRVMAAAPSPDIKYTGYIFPESSRNSASATFANGTIYMGTADTLSVCTYKTFVPSKPSDREPPFVATDAPHTSSTCTPIK